MSTIYRMDILLSRRRVVWDGFRSANASYYFSEFYDTEIDMTFIISNSLNVVIITRSISYHVIFNAIVDMLCIISDELD